MMFALQNILLHGSLRRCLGRVALMAFLMFSAISSRSQILIPEGEKAGNRLVGRFLAVKSLSSDENPKVKISARETSVQKHDGVEVFREERDVEYVVKQTDKDYKLTRKVVKTIKTHGAGNGEHFKIDPDMTSKHLSGMMSPRKVRKNQAEADSLHLIWKASKDNGTTCVFIDKKASLEAEKGVGIGIFDVKAMGHVMKFDAMTEQLYYASTSDSLYLDDLKKIVSTVAFTETDDKGNSSKGINVETIEIKNMVRE